MKHNVLSSGLAILLILAFAAAAARTLHAQHVTAIVFDTASAGSLATATVTVAGTSSAVSPALRLDQVQEKRQHYATRGALIGGIALGIAAAIASHAFCQDDDSSGSDNCFLNSVGAFFVGSVPGSVIGGLIGYAITKRPD